MSQPNQTLHYVPVGLILFLWFVFLVLLYVYTRYIRVSPRKPKVNPDRYTYEEIATIYDNCNIFSANYVYFLRIVYGQHNKKFFFPSATFRVLLLTANGKQVGKIEIRPEVLLENHRKHLGKWHKGRGPKAKKQLNVLIKRKQELSNVKHIVLDHSIYGGTLYVYGFYLINLIDNRVYCSPVDMPITRLEKGVRPEVQRFELRFLGRYTDYIGPSYNLNVLEFLLIAQLGVSMLFIWCSASVSCNLGVMFVCRDYQSLSHALETSIFAALTGLVVALTCLLVHRYVCKTLNAQLKAASCIVWLAVKYVPYTIWVICAMFDMLAIWLIMMAEDYRTNKIRDTQRLYWLVAAGTALVMYLMTMLVLLQVLLLHHQFDDQEMPKIDFDSNKVKLAKNTDKLMPHYSNMSTRNLKITPKRVRASAKSTHDTTAAGAAAELMEKPKTISKIVSAFQSNTERSTKQSQSEPRSFTSRRR